MTARDYLRVLREGWIIILVCALLGAAAAAYVTTTRSPVYQATSTLAVSTCVAVENSPVCDPVGGMSFAIQRASIYSTTATSLPVLRRTLELTDVVSKRADLQDHVAVKQTSGSPVIEVTATWGNPIEAADIANAMAQALVEYARESIDSFESEMTTVSFSIISEAAPPTDPMDSSSQTIVFATALGLFFGLGLAFARYFLGGKLRGRDDAEALTGIDVLANVPLGFSPRRFRSARPGALAPAADAYRRLRTTTSVRVAEANIHTLLVVAPANGTASSAVARGLAIATAETGARVALVDLDFSNTDKSDAEQPAGIIDVLDGSTTLNEALQQVDDSTLFNLPAGSRRSDPSVKLVSPQLDEILIEVQDQFDFVIVNASPVLPTADALSIARFADGVLIVAVIRATKRDDLRESVRALELSGTAPIGLATVT